eukprot:533513-Pelagomonas_calceolata.AAC.3
MPPPPFRSLNQSCRLLGCAPTCEEPDRQRVVKGLLTHSPSSDLGLRQMSSPGTLNAARAAPFGPFLPFIGDSPSWLVCVSAVFQKCVAQYSTASRSKPLPISIVLFGPSLFVRCLLYAVLGSFEARCAPSLAQVQPDICTPEVQHGVQHGVRSPEFMRSLRCTPSLVYAQPRGVLTPGLMSWPV